MQKKVLVIDNVHPLIISRLSDAGYRCDQFPGYGRKEFEGIVSGYQGILIRSGICIDKDFLDLAENLEFIGRSGSGMEGVDVACAESRGIRCLNSPEGNRDAVGEHATGLLLTLLNNIAVADRQVRNGQWIREGNRGTEIKGKTVGIIGYGNTGSAFAQRLRGFEAEVISYDKYKTAYSDGNTREVAMEEIFEKCDILSLHVPLTGETHHLVNGEFIRRFRKPFYLLNTSRGKVVDTAALVEALSSGKVAGAGLDVLEYEANSFEQISGEGSPELEYLKKAENVVMTPHIAGWTRESAVRLASVLADKILKIQ